MLKYGGQSSAAYVNPHDQEEDNIGASILNPPNVTPYIKAARWWKNLEIKRIHILGGFTGVLLVALIVTLCIVLTGQSKTVGHHKHKHHDSHVQPIKPSKAYPALKLPKNTEKMTAMGFIDYMYKQYYWYVCKFCEYKDSHPKIASNWGCTLHLYNIYTDLSEYQSPEKYGIKKAEAKKRAAENATLTLWSSANVKFNYTSDSDEPLHPPGAVCQTPIIDS